MVRLLPKRLGAIPLSGLQGAAIRADHLSLGARQAAVWSRACSSLSLHRSDSGRNQMPLLCGEIFSLRMFWLVVQSGVPRLTGNQVHVYSQECCSGTQTLVAGRGKNDLAVSGQG